MDRLKMKEASKMADQKLISEKMRIEEDFRRSKEQGLCQRCGSQIGQFTTQQQDNEPDFL